ncbi:MAG: hypothetical protein K6E32_07265 [Lachnospiraceae bacterium]|nr:hypothetical protein [Lachnospiraceae bacterium]
MGKKNANELEEMLRRMKEREAALKAELAEQRKAEDARARKERSKKLCVIGEMLVERFGEGVLDHPETLNSLLAQRAGAASNNGFLTGVNLSESNGNTPRSEEDL